MSEASNYLLSFSILYNVNIAGVPHDIESQEFSELFPHRKLKTDIQYEYTFEFSDN